MKKIIVYRLGSLGDTVVALPFFNYLRDKFPHAEILVLTNHPVSQKAPPLLSVLGENNQIVNGVISYPVGVRSFSKLIALHKILKNSNADALIYLISHRTYLQSLRDLFFLKISGFKNIYGFPFSKKLRNNLYDLESNSFEYETLRLKRCFKDFGDVDVDSYSAWDLHLSSDELMVGESFIENFSMKPFFTINIGGKDPLKNWGLSNWFKLMMLLKNQFKDYGLFAIGADADFEDSQKLLDSWGGNSINGCGKLSPRESAAALKKTKLFIGHDSGPLHLAASVRVPSIGLFGGLNQPKVWHPYGSHVFVIQKTEGINHITNDEVFSLVNRVLSGD